MPEIDFAPESQRYQSVNFDKLKLRKDERARVVLLEKPHFEWVHTLKSPKILNGEPVMVEVTRRGEKVQDYDMDFVGRPLCLGDAGTLQDDGVDDKNCPACKRSAETDEVNPPERRFAANVIRYKIRTDGTPVTPFSCDSVVWQFGEGYFNKLVAIAQEFGALVGKDLILGPCQVESYQKYDISAGGQNLWTVDERVTAIVKETHDNNRVADLTPACGRKQEARWMREDIEKIRKRWAQARGDQTQPQAEHEYSADAAELSKGLDDLLAGSSPATGVDAQLLARDQLAAAPSAATPNPPAADEGEAIDFSKLLEGLKP